LPLFANQKLSEDAINLSESQIRPRSGIKITVPTLEPKLFEQEKDQTKGMNKSTMYNSQKSLEEVYGRIAT